MAYQCEDGFISSSGNKRISSICTKTKNQSAFRWIPALQEHTCTSLRLILHERKNSSSFNCPGDTISYKCFVKSSEPNDMYLTWDITFPGQKTQSVTYSRSSFPEDMVKLSMNVTTILDTLRYEYMESTILLTQLPDINLRNALLACSTMNMEKATFVDVEIPLGIFSIFIPKLQ